LTQYAGVDRIWLHRWIRKYSYSDPRVEVDRDQLDGIVHDFVLLHPERGERMIIGFLRSERLKVTREEVIYSFIITHVFVTFSTAIDTCIHTAC
jgi:hypothetical protein